MPVKPYRQMIVLLLALGTIAAEPKSEHTDRYGDALPQGAIARMGTIRLRDGANSQIAFSPDGKLLASGSWGGQLRVWDAATGKEIHVFAAHQDYYGSFAFTPDCKSLVARGRDRTIRFWDLTTGKLIHTFQAPEGVPKIALSPNGKILAMIGEKTARLWDAATGKEIRTITAPQKDYRSLAFSPNGKVLAAGGADRNDHLVCLWDAATSEEIRTFQGRPREEKRRFQISPVHIYSVAFSPDGKTLASAGDDAVRLWDIASAKQIHLFDPPCQNWCVAFTPDGKALASVGHEEQIHLWDTASGKEILHYELPTDGVRSLAFSPDGRILAAGDQDRIRLWDARTGQPIRDHRGHSSPVFSLTYSPNGKLLASGGEDETVRLWDSATGKEIRIFRGHRKNVSSVAFSPDGKTLASGGRDKTVRLWEVASEKLIRTLHCPEWVTSVAFSPDGKTLATSSLRNGFSPSIRLWNPKTGKELPVDVKHSGSIESVAFSPDGKQLLASGGRDGEYILKEIFLWEAATGKAIRVLSGHQERVNSVAFSPDGRLIASGSHDNTARLWDADSGSQILVLRHRQEVWPVAFSPDGMLLASGGWDQKVHLWDVLTGKEIHAFRGHRNAIFSISFSPDGRTLASGGRDTSCLLWDVGEPLRTKPPGGWPSDRLRERLWTTLGESDALAAWRAVFTLAADSEQSVPFLDRHLQATLLDPQQVRRWIADLDSDTFAVREAAQRELEQWGEVVAAALKKALRDKPSLEARKRMERLLADMTSRAPSGKYLAVLRALIVLERIGTPAARRVLEKMAQGNTLDRRTRAAKSALKRLASRRDTMP